MNSQKNPEKDDALDRVLRKWTIDSTLPPRFQEQVWQRIAKVEARSERFSWAALGSWIQTFVPKPKFAYAYLGILLLTGVAAGAATAQIKTSRVESELSGRYVQSIDPFQTALSKP